MYSGIPFFLSQYVIWLLAVHHVLEDFKLSAAVICVHVC